MQYLARAVEEDSGDQGIALGLFLFGNHRIKAADGISLKSTHGAAAVEDKDNLGQILFHLGFLHSNLPLWFFLPYGHIIG